MNGPRAHQDDERFMQLALSLGRRGLGNAWPNPAVGAVTVKDGILLGRGWTMPGGRPHAETEALWRAGTAAAGATLYVTLEPCSHHGKTPPCADAIVEAGIARVVCALGDPNPKVAGEGYARLRQAGIAVDEGVCAQDALRAHAGHIRRIRDRRPHVTLKLAVSADGKAGLAGRRPAAVTGERAREHVHLMRAMNDAVLTGIGTALADDPLLTCRLPGMAERSPVRVVLDSALRLPLQSRLVQTARATPLWVVAAPQAGREKEFALVAAGAVVMRAPGTAAGLDLAALLTALAERGITRLMVEGGPKLVRGMLDAGLIDELALLRSSVTLGADAIDAVEGYALTALTQAPQLKSCGADTLGADTIEFYERA